MEVKSGFPVDDEHSIHCGSGDGNLSLYYTHQFVQNEILQPVRGDGDDTFYDPITYGKVVPSTLSGTLHSSGVAVQTFEIDHQGSVLLIPIGLGELEALSLHYNESNRQISIVWNSDDPKLVKETHLVVNYEYEMDTNNTKPNTEVVGWLVAHTNDVSKPYSFMFLPAGSNAEEAREGVEEVLAKMIKSKVAVAGYVQDILAVARHETKGE